LELKNKQLLIELTNLCDAHCVICPREQYRQKLQHMKMPLFRKIIDDAVQYDIESIDTCGYGEAFLDPKLFDKLAYIHEKLPRAEVFVSTTAYHMTADKWDQVAKYVDILKLSIYGATKGTYEAFHRGKVKYDQAMRNIHGFINYTNGNRPRTVGLFVDTDLNHHEREDWLRTWEPRLDEVFVWKPHNWVKCRNYRTVDKLRQATCGRPDNGPMYIHADGKVGPCCWDINNEIPLGDISCQTIEEIYKGEPYRKLRMAHRAGVFNDYICKDCDQTNFNPDVLIYSNNPDRKVGQLTSNNKALV